MNCDLHARYGVAHCVDCAREKLARAVDKGLDGAWDKCPGGCGSIVGKCKCSTKGVALATDQPEPIKNELPAAWDLVMTDMRARDRFGKDKYGVRLQPNNGRDFLADAYQEALDLAVYLRGAIYERDNK